MSLRVGPGGARPPGLTLRHAQVPRLPRRDDRARAVRGVDRGVPDDEADPGRSRRRRSWAPPPPPRRSRWSGSRSGSTSRSTCSTSAGCGRSLQGDFGTSIAVNVPVAQLVWPKFWNTVLLTAGSLVICIVVGLGVGIVSGTRQYSWFDRISMSLTLIVANTPAFWLGLVLMVVMALHLGWFPATGMYSMRASQKTFGDLHPPHGAARDHDRLGLGRDHRAARPLVVPRRDPQALHHRAARQGAVGARHHPAPRDEERAAADHQHRRVFRSAT